MNFVKVEFLCCQNHDQNLSLDLSNDYFFKHDIGKKKNYKGTFSVGSTDEILSEDCFLGIIKHSQIIFFYLYKILCFKHKLRKFFFINQIYYHKCESGLTI